MTSALDSLAGIEGFGDLTPEQRELLALLLEEQGVGAEQPGTASRAIARRKAPGTSAPLSFAQQRLWFLDQLEPGSPMYNMPAAARLHGTLSIPVLQAALDELAARHEVLRSVFTAGEDGEPVQQVLPSLHVPVAIHDLHELAGADQEQELVRLAAAETQRPFDLARGPLVRVTLLVLSGHEYLLLLNMHHIVTDGWSIGVFLRELGEVYAAFVAGRPSPLAPLPLQYGDYALWQRDPEQSEMLERQSAFWRETLHDAPAVLELPFDRPRPAVQTYNGDAIEFVVPARVRDGLNKLAQAEGATLFMALLSAFQALLYRYSRQTDICVGTPIANRTRGELEGLIGFFANTLVLRGQLTPRMSYRELLRQMREVTLAAYEHQDVPFEQVVEVTQPERSLSYSPLFQVMFVLQNTPQGTRQLPGMSLSPVRFPSVTAKFDLTLNMSERPDGVEGGGIAGAIEYNTDLFDRETVERFAEHFQNLCAAVAGPPQQRPDMPVGMIPLLSAHEQDRLLRTWNATEMDADLDHCIHELVEAQVDRTPDAIAISYKDQRLTYAELERRANQIAHHLRELGAGPERLVGVCMERSPELIIALLGVLKAGAAYVPMDPRYPRERLEFMAEDAQVAALITESAVADAAPQNAPHVIWMDRDRARLAGQPGERLPLAGTSRNLSYVLFTSGSTGRPKGVAIQHRSAIALIHWARRVFPAESLFAVLASTSISFDLSVYEIFVTLSTGGRLVLVENALDVVGNPAVEGVRLINTVPSAATELLRLGAIPRSVRTINLAGEPLAQQLVGQLYDLSFVQDVYDLYGPTEDTTYSTYTRRVRGGVATIGRPIDNTQAYVLDELLNPTPQGVPGEVYLAGDGLARGYLNRPDLTAERFVPNPFAAAPGDRMYRTGDLARYRSDGTLQYLGRIDHQVKLRGFRIELGEIETAIEACDGVAKAVVLVREDAAADGATRDKQLVAYVEWQDASAGSPAGLRAELSKRLPSHMVPAAYVEIKEWPLSPNGKIDRRRLPAPGVTAAHERGGIVAPRSPVEEAIAGIFGSVLRLPQVSIDDDFFHLGGHSLLATQLISRVRRAFDVDVPLRAVFVTPTVAGLAATVEALLDAGSGAAPPSIRPVDRQPDDSGAVRLPLSFAQQRLWFLDQLEPGGSLYNIPSAVRLSGNLDRAALRRTLDTLAGRHESLRTTFEAIDGKPVQVISAQGALSLEVVDLSGLAQDEQEAAIMREAIAEARRPFDLARGPLVRATLLRLVDGPAGQEHVLLITMHHIISDGWSTGVMVREFGELYAAFASGSEPSLPPLALQYADYAVWQRGWLLGEGEESGAPSEPSPLDRQLAYWRDRLAGAPALLELPTDRPRPAVQTHHGASLPFELPRDLAERVREISREEGATVFMTLMAAFQALLGRLSNQTDICVGTPVANRTHAELEGIIGFFVNTLVLRADLSADGAQAGAPTFRELLRQVRAAALGAYAHQDVPFEKLVDALDVPRNMTHSPLFQAMFVWQEQRQSASGAPVHLPGLSLAPIPVHGGTTAFDLTLAMADSGVDGRRTGLSGWLEYATELFDRSSAERYVRYFQALLAGMLSAPDRPVTHVDILSPEERRRIFEAWNDTTTPVPALSLHEAFEKQAGLTPDAVALVFAGGETRPRRELTYGELNRLADALACELQRLGVEREEIVAISVEKSAEQVAGLLGILKAGAAYLPIDPAYPGERIAYLLADSGARVLLTQAHLAPRFASPGLRHVIRLDEFAATPQARETAKPVGRAAPGGLASTLAYVIYTSGSTGQPKGVMVEHRSIVNHAHALMAQTGIGPGDRMLQFVSLSFDAAGEEFYPTLFSGATLVLPGDSQDLMGPDLSALCEQYGVTIVHMPATAWHGIVDDLAARDLPWRGPLRLLMLGGDAPDAGRLAAFMKLLGREIPFMNLYGPTEATITTTSYCTTDFASPRRVPIGRPIANVRVYVLDRSGQPSPVGVPGEIYIGGAGVARGYLNRPELTAERFESRYNSRLYRTGDLGRWLPDGNLEFLGRADDQVKIRGYRIELGEIEGALAVHPGVKECAVLVRADAPDGTRRLVAYFAAASEPPPSVADLRSFLLRTLPDYMIPPVFVRLPALPLNTHGKVDRAALRHASLPAAGDAERGGTGADFRAPATPAELALAGIWSQVLGIPKVGADDNFFELGGDSILSIQVIARANQAGLHLTPKQLFQAPTLAALAALAGTESASAVHQGPVEGVVSLTPIQRWFFDPATWGGELAVRNHWNQSVLLSVRRRLDPEGLRASVVALLEHHDALRLRFVETETGWQAINTLPDPSLPAPFDHVDLSDLPEAEFSPVVERLCGETQKSLDISRGPLMRAVYYDAGPESAGRLLLVIHHLAIDGVSWRVLLEDLQNAYGQHTRTGVVQLPPKTASYKAWAERLASHALSESGAAELDFWLERVGGWVPSLPTDFAAGPTENTEADAAQVGVTLSHEDTEALLTQANAAYNTEIQDLLLTALAQTIAKWTGTPTLYVHLEGHGREELGDEAERALDVSRTVGWFTSMYPVRLDLPWGSEEAPGESIVAVKEQLRAVPNHGLGYGLLRYLGDDDARAALASQAEAEISFNYLGQFDQALNAGGAESVLGPAAERPGLDRGPANRRSHLVDVTAAVAGRRLSVSWTYSRTLHEEATVQQLAEWYLQALTNLIAHCRSPEAGAYTPSDFPLAELDQKQLDKVLKKVNPR